MDFDPHHAKWQCCCCHLSSGLKILGLFEIALSIFGVAIASINLAQDLKLPPGSDDREIFFLSTLILLLFLIALTSIFMIYGIKKLKYKFMYPTLIARVLLIIFVTVFGVSMVVQPGADDDIPVRPTSRSKQKQMKVEKPQFEQDDPPMALRFMFLVFLMIFISIGVFYTIYLVVRCMRYVRAYDRLERRRSSVIMAGQIDPELLMARRSSRSSHISST